MSGSKVSSWYISTTGSSKSVDVGVRNLPLAIPELNVSLQLGGGYNTIEFQNHKYPNASAILFKKTQKPLPNYQRKYCLFIRQMQATVGVGAAAVAIPTPVSYSYGSWDMPSQGVGNVALKLGAPENRATEQGPPWGFLGISLQKSVSLSVGSLAQASEQKAWLLMGSNIQNIMKKHLGGIGGMVGGALARILSNLPASFQYCACYEGMGVTLSPTVIGAGVSGALAWTFGMMMDEFILEPGKKGDDRQNDWLYTQTYWYDFGGQPHTWVRWYEDAPNPFMEAQNKAFRIETNRVWDTGSRNLPGRGARTHG